MVSWLKMADSTQCTVRIKWIRSGIGFDRRQSEVIRSLGLRRLNQVVERPDNAPVRGLVAKVAHLVEITTASPAPEWTSMPGYTVTAAEIHTAGAPAQVATEEAAEAQVPSPNDAPTASSEGVDAVAPERVEEHRREEEASSSG